MAKRISKSHDHRYMQHPTQELAVCCDICGFATYRQTILNTGHGNQIHNGPFPHVAGVPASCEIRAKAQLINGRWIDKEYLAGGKFY
jgi:hypothetical protein